MKWMEIHPRKEIKMNQNEEKTIKDRKIVVKLSDADIDRICNKAGEAGLSVSELLENFIGDLVGGTYSNGSDERDAALDWYERCWFGMFQEDTLLRYLLCDWYYDPKEFIELLENIEDAKGIIENYENNCEEYDEEDLEEIEHAREDLRDLNKEYQEIVDSFIKRNPNVNMTEEIEKVKKWVSEKNDLIYVD